MPNLPFTLRQLEVFSSLCATRSFRRTAESLGISQASVSNQMKALEEQLGLALFARRPGQRPTLTPEGTAFLDDLRVFQAAGEALAAASWARPRAPRKAGMAIPIRMAMIMTTTINSMRVNPPCLSCSCRAARRRWIAAITVFLSVGSPAGRSGPVALRPRLPAGLPFHGSSSSLMELIGP